MPLTFFYGTVSSGKTAQLLLKLHQCNTSKVLVKSSVDTRNGINTVWSRIPGLSMTADIIVYPDQKITIDTKIETIFVDEIQFFTPVQIAQLHKLANRCNVLCYGLKSNYKQQLFDASSCLFALADNIIEIPTNCKYCTSKATFNLKITPKETDVNNFLLGTEEAFVPVCAKCYLVK